ncbi:MAG: hypothetical protein AAFQ43_02425 [Bacteroidota bacterium]
MNPDPRPTDTATLPLFPPGERANPPKASGAESTESPRETGNPWDWCPNCGSRLHNERCKRRCPRCFYFMSCSDFD